ncbi:hypothetical protein B0H67DRAFT_2587 [Lasiosphaeris hirsuta]|uniref:Uncharacterized protein n=1 Tax=Lasiosphaeris hirsuta TaxID=260670 RepID=A0AA40E922_9PEZI|nr:hypothetical protein B0H67DRAFT_2587 [Lasiosphaeris hirsuta]
MFWEKALAKKELPWTKLMEDLNGISKRETEGTRFASIEVKGAKGNKLNNPSGNTTNNGNKIKCDKCQRSYPKSWAHQSCSHHYPLGGICWTCNPEQAPDTWAYKKTALERKARGTTVTTVALSNTGSGIANLTKVGSSNLLFSTNMGI